MRFWTLSALTLSLLALLLTLAVGVTCQPVPACAADLDHTSGHASLISRRAQAPCHDAGDEDDDAALDEQLDSPEVSSWQGLFTGHDSERNYYGNEDSDIFEQVDLKIRSTKSHSKTQLERHGVHHLDVGKHMTDINKVHHSARFSHPSSFGLKTIKGSTVNKWARKAVNNVGGRKKVIDNNKLSTLGGLNAKRLRGYPKTGSGFSKTDAHDPVPKDHIAYHGLLKPTRSEKKGGGLTNPDPKRKYPGPTRVIIHRHPNDKAWQIKASFHDHSKPIPSTSKSHPFTEIKAQHA